MIVSFEDYRKREERRKRLEMLYEVCIFLRGKFKMKTLKAEDLIHLFKIVEHVSTPLYPPPKIIPDKPDPNIIA